MTCPTPDYHARARALLHAIGQHEPINDAVVRVAKALRDAYAAGATDARREREAAR